MKISLRKRWSDLAAPLPTTTLQPFFVFACHCHSFIFLLFYIQPSEIKITAVQEDFPILAEHERTWNNSHSNHSTSSFSSDSAPNRRGRNILFLHLNLLPQKSPHASFPFTSSHSVERLLYLQFPAPPLNCNSFRLMNPSAIPLSLSPLSPEDSHQIYAWESINQSTSHSLSREFSLESYVDIDQPTSHNLSRELSSESYDLIDYSQPKNPTQYPSQKHT